MHRTHTALLSAGLVGLLALNPLVAQTEDSNAATSAFQKIEAAYQRDTKAYREAILKVAATPEYKDALAKRDYTTMRDLRAAVKLVDRASFVERFLKLEEATRGSITATKCLDWTLQNGSRDKACAARVHDVIAEHYASKPALQGIAEKIFYLRYPLGEAKYGALLDKILATNEHKMVQAHIYYHRATMSKPGRNGKGGDLDKYNADLKRCMKLAKGTDLADLAMAPIFAKNRLQIGMEVPDIAGKDLDGNPFKLSDYRGKVVVLDFWGDW